MVLAITYQDAFEELLGAPVDLPTSEPANPQYEWTVAQADLPAFSLLPISLKYIGMFWTAGKNLSGGAATVSYRMLKNGVSVDTSGGAVNNNYYWTWTHTFYDIAVGGVLGIKLWANAAAINRDYQAHQVNPTRLFITPKAEVLKPCYFSAGVQTPVLKLGNPAYSATGILLFFPGTELFKEAILSTYTQNIPVWRHHDTYGLFQTDLGDYITPNSASMLTSATNRPRASRSSLPTQIIFRSYGELT